VNLSIIGAHVHASLNRKRPSEATDKSDVTLSTQAFDRNERVQRRLLLALCVLSAFLGRLCYLARPFDSDGAIFIYQGKLVSEGGRYLADFIDNKFPTVGLVTSFFWRIWGAWWPGYVLSGLAMSCAASLILARSARRHFGENAALPALLMAIVYLNFTTAVFGGFQLETIQILFSVIAASAALNAIASRDSRDAYVLGLASGCAAMLKPTGIAVLVSFAVVALLQSAREPSRLLKSLAFAGCGLAVPLLVSLVYLLSADNLHDLPALYEQIRTYAANSAWQWGDLVKPFIVLGLLAFPVLVRGAIFRKMSDRVESNTSRSQIAFLVLWLALEMAGVVMQRRMYAYHFLVLAPPAALLFAALPRTDRAIPLIGSLAPIVFFSIYGSAVTWTYSRGAQNRLEVSNYLAAHASPGAHVWQDDYPRLLIETGLRPGSRVPLTFLFANHDRAPLDFTRIILDDFATQKPDYVLLPARFDLYIRWHADNILEFERFPIRRANYILAWEQIRQYVRQNYVAEATVGDNQVWLRRSADSSAGNRISNVVPLPGSLETSIDASWAWTTCLTIDKPSPVPPISRDLDLSTR